MKRSRIRRTSTKSGLVKRLDKLFREILLKERGSKCEWCGKTTQVFVSHILPKGRYPKLRWVKENVLLLCYYCHFHKWHKDPMSAYAFMTMTKGDVWKDQLLEIERFIGQHNLIYLQCLEELFKVELENQ